MSIHALMLSWVFILFFVIFSLVIVEGRLQIWILLSALILMNVNWEVERLMRVFFVQNKLMLAANRSSVELENLHNINLLKASSENVKKLAEAEKKQLRSLVHYVFIY
jgi:hypothetical protein